MPDSASVVRTGNCAAETPEIRLGLLTPGASQLTIMTVSAINDDQPSTEIARMLQARNRCHVKTIYALTEHGCVAAMCNRLAVTPNPRATALCIPPGIGLTAVRGPLVLAGTSGVGTDSARLAGLTLDQERFLASAIADSG